MMSIRTKWIMLLAILLLGQVTLYRYWGASDEFQHVKAYQSISLQLDEMGQNKNLTLEQALTDLDKLSNTIDYSHKGLARMGTIYSELGRFEEAVKVLEKAMVLSPSQSDYALQWIYHQSFLHQGKLPREARVRAEGLLSDPKAKEAALNMLAMDDYFQGNYQEALNHWNFLLQNDMNLTTERRQVLEKAMANAQAKISQLNVSGG